MIRAHKRPRVHAQINILRYLKIKNFYIVYEIQRAITHLSGRTTSTMKALMGLFLLASGSLALQLRPSIKALKVCGKFRTAMQCPRLVHKKRALSLPQRASKMLQWRLLMARAPMKFPYPVKSWWAFIPYYTRTCPRTWWSSLTWSSRSPFHSTFLAWTDSDHGIYHQLWMNNFGPKAYIKRRDDTNVSHDSVADNYVTSQLKRKNC